MQGEGALAGDVEVRRAGNRIGHVQVVRQHPGIEQAFREFDQDFAVVVNSAQKDTLVEPCEAIHGLHGAHAVIVDLVGMIEVRDDDDLRSDARQHIHEARGDALRNHHGHAGVDSDSPDVVDGRHAFQEAAKVGIRQHERLAAGEDDLGDGRVAAYGFQGRKVRWLPMFGVGKVSSEAVPAVHRARAGGNDQRTATVFLQNADPRHGCRFVQRICLVAGCRLRLRADGQDLPQQGVVRVTATHPGDVRSRHPQRETGTRGQSVHGFAGDTHEREQFVQVGDRPGKLAPPRFRLRIDVCSQGFGRYHPSFSLPMRRLTTDHEEDLGPWRPILPTNSDPD